MPEQGLHGEAAAQAILEDALRGSPADQTELVLLAGRTDVTRYANSEIHQNVSQANTRVAVRVAVGRATARVFTNSLDVPELRKAIEAAVRLAKMQSPNPRFQSLPAPGTGYDPSPDPPKCYYESTARLSPMDRAQA